MLQNLKSQLTHQLINVPGWHTRRKIVVIESDDWGSIRMPSKEVYEKLLKKNIRVDNDPYCKYDCLATPEDLEALFDVLYSVKDKNGRHAVLTANTVVANPDFEKIKSSGFSEYHYKSFIQSLFDSPNHHGSFSLWKEGISNSIFIPQFHGREHLNVKKWMKDLNSGEVITRIAFEMGTFGLTPKVDPIITNYMGAFNSGLKEDIEIYKNILKDGLDLFENIFGYRSLSFIPTTYTWSPEIEPSVKNFGVKFLQGMVHQRIPLDDDTNFTYKKNNFLGHKSKYSGLIYLMRNCYFEPSQDESFDWVGNCLKRIEIAFRWHKPATISMHRLNMIGAIDQNNRKRNLMLLKQLLNKIVNRWPNIEFMTSPELGNILLDNCGYMDNNCC